MRHFGPRLLIEDASVNSKSTTLWNGEIGYHASSRARVVLELFNIFNVANFSNPTADSRLSDFLVLSALSGGNGQPRAAQFSVRFGF